MVLTCSIVAIATANLMLRQGIHPKIVSELLGHSSISITLDIYSHVLPGLQKAAAQRFDEAFNFGHNNYVEKLVTPRRKNEVVEKFG
jgi:hypothetical protein